MRPCYFGSQEKPKGPKAQVNAVFFRRVLQLLKIGIPGVLTSEFGMVILVAASLVGRTLCDLYLIKKATEIETCVTLVIQRYWSKLRLTNDKTSVSIGRLSARMDHCSRNSCFPSCV